MAPDRMLLSSLDQAYGLLASLQAPSHAGLLDRVFGEGAQTAYESSALGTSVDPFGWIGLTLVDGSTLRGHPGAFASQYLDGKPEILLNKDWLQTATSDQITGVLLEEFGHAIDWAVNGESDTPGDEGLVFAKALRTEAIAQNSLDRPNRFDHGSITLNYQEIRVEFASTTGFNSANWTSTISGGDASINTGGAPGSITITGSNDNSLSLQTADYTTTSVVNAPGFAKYNWSFNNIDVPGSDKFGYLTGTAFSRLDDITGSGSQNNYVTSFFTTPSSFGYRVSTDDDSGGALTATVSNFSFTPIADTYFVRFNQIFAATLAGGTTFNVGSLLSTDIWIFPENPISDSDFTSNFNNNGSTNEVWIISSAINNGQPLAIYLTNGKEVHEGVSEDVWAFNTIANGSGDYYLLTSGNYLQTTSSQQINSSIGLADLDQLRGEQGDTTPPTAAIALYDACIKIGDTSTVTITFSEVVAGFELNDLTATNGTLSNFSGSGTTYTATFTPTVGIEDTTNVVTLNTSYTDLAGNTGTSATSANYTVDTVRPTVDIFFGDPTQVSLQRLNRPIRYGETPYLYFRFSETVWNFSLSDTKIEGGTLRNLEIVNDDLTAGTDTGSRIYRAQFTPHPNSSSNSLPIGASITGFTDRAQANCGSTGNSNLPTTAAAANLRHSADLARPTATLIELPSSIIAGSIVKLQIRLSEGGTGFDINSLSVSGGTLRNFRRVGATLYEVELVAPTSAGRVSFQVLPGSFLDWAGNTSIAPARGKGVDQAIFQITAPPRPRPVPVSARTSVRARRR